MFDEVAQLRGMKVRKHSQTSIIILLFYLNQILHLTQASTSALCRRSGAVLILGNCFTCLLGLHNDIRANFVNMRDWGLVGCIFIFLNDSH